MKKIYNFTNKPGQSKNNFLQNQWAKHYRRRFASYRAYLDAMESKAVLDEATQTYKFQTMKPAATTPDRISEVLKASLTIERMVKRNHRDIRKAQSTRGKIQDLVNKYSPK